MLNFAREVYVCVCPTQLAAMEQDPKSQWNGLSFKLGAATDLERLDKSEHAPEYLEKCQERFVDHYWLIGELDSKIVTYTWLHQKSKASYRFLEGCDILLSDSCGYGFDAWTPPHLRGQGLRRVAFVEELRILRSKGLKFEASFFVKHQLEGATRSLAKVGIKILPVWRMKVKRDKTFDVQCLNEGLSDVVWPVSTFSE